MKETSVHNPQSRAPQPRYDLGARWFHWLTTLLVFTVIPLGWIFGAFKTKPGAPDTFVAPFPGTPADYASAHMTVGLLLFAIVLPRIIYRYRHKPPPLPGAMGALEKGFAHVTHWLLYAVLIVMPLSGYIMSSGDKPPIRILGLIDFPKVPITPGQGMAAAIVHVYGQFAVYALIVLHLAGTAWHLLMRRDNILGRMLPEQSNED